MSASQANASHSEVGASHSEVGASRGEVGASRRTARYPLAVAPMMDLTDRHFRYLVRLITTHTLLYSEMITAKAVLHGNLERLLAFDPAEGPVALQLGGDDPEELAAATRLGASFGYSEVNLNVGCPSSRVSSGNFGACLMADPGLVSECLAAMRAATSLAVTVKHRIGIDHRDSYQDLRSFVTAVASAGSPVAGSTRFGGSPADVFTVHARKAWLQGLSPKQNRTVPPLRYADVYRLKRELPELTIELNGGVDDLAAATEHLRHVDGVMFGRAAYQEPFMLAGADAVIAAVTGGEPRPARARSRREVVHDMLPYLELRLNEGVPLHAMTRHLLNLFRAQPGGKRWRRALTEGAHRPGSGPELLQAALSVLPNHVLDSPLVRTLAA